MDYVLVTGATGVLGKAICSELAKEGKNLFLTATNFERLESLKNALVGTYVGVNVQICPANLADERDRERLFECAEPFRFSHLFCVAGIDNQMPFTSYTQQKLLEQVRVNFEGNASVMLFALKHSENLKICTVSSVSGEQPLPYFAIYSATKSALTFLSLAVGGELRKNCSVTAVIAGGIYTRADVKEYIKKQGFLGRKAAKTPEYVAVKCIKAVKKSKKKYIVGNLNRLIMFCSKLMPTRLKMRIMAKRLKQTTKNYY